MRRALLFDMDGTLVHSDPIHAAVFVDMLAEHGIEMTVAHYTSQLLGRRNVEIFGELLPKRNALALDAEKEKRFRDRLVEIPDLVPGARDLLARARASGWGTALVTNACRANAEAVINRFGISAQFDTISIAEECPRGKPSPDVYVHAMEMIGANATDCLAFEDSPTGLAAAKAAGTVAIGLESSLSAETLRAAGATETLTNFTDPRLEPLLRKFEGYLP